MSTKNKLYTRSYAAKRLREAEFIVHPLDITYTKNDIRYWTMILNPNIHNIFITCYLNRDNRDDYYFKLHSSRNTINVKTKSMLVLIESIRKLIQEIEINK